MKTFKEQYDKLIKAYMENKVEPFRSCACFVGNLLDGNSLWAEIRDFPSFTEKAPKTYYDGLCIKAGKRIISEISDNTYSVSDILLLEEIFMITYCNESGINLFGETYLNENCEFHINEDALFKAFEATLLKLRELHEKKGEVIENYIFKKRELPEIVRE